MKVSSSDPAHPAPPAAGEIGSGELGEDSVSGFREICLVSHSKSLHLPRLLFFRYPSAVAAFCRHLWMLVKLKSPEEEKQGSCFKILTKTFEIRFKKRGENFYMCVIASLAKRFPE